MKEAKTHIQPRSSKNKRGINELVVENMTSLLEQLLFQSGLSKKDSQAILSKLFVAHSPPLTTPPKASCTNKTENEGADFYFLKKPKTLYSP